MFGSVEFVKHSSNELQAIVDLVVYVTVKVSNLLSSEKKRSCA